MTKQKNTFSCGCWVTVGGKWTAWAEERQGTMTVQVFRYPVPIADYDVAKKRAEQLMKDAEQESK